ncbi:MAG: DNA repair ATPase [Gammaproteobacteria bacterium]|nr:DNA repair ATPase [Gammaproteobacteria bacterium]MBU1504843.1 DNA repair ATPase [Gammaproteobacteria bacterium]MBU2122446.1 DNA repair ATPase [Gammaproteobacteria bacterium]MBU2172114.1 DNA repair ATPase [Gammaproteobacteria bacterium]MBU2273486.1 DNA repair ATPase [Gammaproteobacteria bacterium]
MNTKASAPESADDDVNANAAAVDTSVANSSSYELLKKRLEVQGDQLLAKAQALNAARIEQFGQRDQQLLMRLRARTEHNCVARDLAYIGGNRLLFGYNVFMGLKRETRVEDVFAIYELAHPGADATGANAENDELVRVPLTDSFLDDPRFVADFNELYTYYKQATLQLLRPTPEFLLAAFQIGQQAQDIRVFRWRRESDGTLKYVDNRGERDLTPPPSHDFAWTPLTRENHVSGAHPHFNVLDTLFVETTGGTLTLKIENNTETGLGIYEEPVDDPNQALGDAEIAYAKLGLLILLQVRPYRENTTRYLVFNQRTRQVVRIDAIGASCMQLPEDHGIIFPGGYYLQSGEHKRFDLPPELTEQLRFTRMKRSPNGEDVAYIFYGTVPPPQGSPATLDAGCYALFTYNLIEKSLAPPILADGYGTLPDGRMLVFQAARGEATRVHPMQLWRTPFATEEHASRQPAGTGFFGRVGNADLVRGISDLLGIARTVREQVPTRTAYEDLIRQCLRARDAYFWLDAPEVQNAAADLTAIEQAAQATLGEFEKVESIRQDTARAMQKAEGQQRELMTVIASQMWRSPNDFVLALNRLRQRQGELHLLRELRYADLAAIDAMAQALTDEQQRVGERAMQFLADEKAFNGQRQALEKVAAALPLAATASHLAEQLTVLDDEAAGLDLLSEQLGSLPGGDAVQRTAILDRIALLYADINRLRADARLRRRSLGAAEQRAEFGAQFKLFSQAVENALELADTPEKCDEALTRLLAQLEDIEARFAEQEEFLTDIATKRESVYEALSARRQSLLEARQRRAKALADATARILDGVPRRVAALTELTQVHSYFAADPMLAKLRDQVAELRRLGAAVAADDIDTRLKTARDQALRSVRDQRELASGEGAASGLRLGAHSFTVNRQPLDLTLVAHDGGLAWQITGTDYLAPAHDERLLALRPYWDQALVSETPALSRIEYLSAEWMDALQNGSTEPGWAELLVQLTELAPDAPLPATLLEPLRRFAAGRYQEGYQRGIHDDDALRLVQVLAPLQAAAGLLVYGPAERALALLYWQHGLREEGRQSLARRARSAAHIAQLFTRRDAQQALEHEAQAALHRFAHEFPHLLHELLPEIAPTPGALTASEHDALATTLSMDAAAYLVRELAERETTPDLPPTWVVSGAGQDLAQGLERALDHGGLRANWQRDLSAAEPAERWRLARHWVRAYAQSQSENTAALLAGIDDAATLLSVDAPRHRVNATLQATVRGLRSEHARIAEGTLAIDLNDFWRRVRYHRVHAVTSFAALQTLRHELLVQEKARLHLAQFQAKPLSTFVRNRLIDEVYLPLIGANLSKQIGAAGDASRTDRMGMLLLISPPGYGKTTIMEYVADRLGLVFVRINCPALGHGVTSIDPATAPNSAARQELEKLNLGLAMGSNVMLYLDDIQHTHPEFLQKFIALADGTRRIEGVWQGKPRTWDMRGKRFAVVMAGNPYTESGDVFRIPDMLANRADIYNLGDVLSGREAVFALSYLENSLTANPVTQPLTAREPKDVHLLVRLAQGEAIDPTTFAHPYSAAELDELKNLFQRLFTVRDLLLKVNLAYIASAAQDDRYRVAPPFRLQGSYRNMARLAPQVTPLMQPHELDALLRDHYRGEAQTLTTGAEENLLQLAHLIGNPTPDEAARWTEICDGYQRQRKMGGAEDDPSVRVTRGLLDIARSVDALQPRQFTEQLTHNAQHLGEQLAQPLAAIAQHMASPTPTPEQQAQAALLARLEPSLAALAELAKHLQGGTTQTQAQMRASLDATAQALQALQASTQALHASAQNSDAAQSQRMVDALLSLSVTYRQLIMPLVRAVETRVGADAKMHEEVERLEGMIDSIRPSPKK